MPFPLTREDHAMPVLYAVFEGGGVKGIAHVGAYARTQLEGLQFQGYAGSSAGAIVASLAAAGYDAVTSGSSLSTLLGLVAKGGLEQWPGDMVQIMRKVNYLDFLDGKEDVSLDDLKRLRQWLKDTGTLISSKAYCKNVRIIVSAWSQSTLLRRVFIRLIEKRGLYGTQSLLKWMHDLLNAKAPKDKQGRVTFGSLFSQGIVLKVLATDLVYRTYKEFNPHDYAAEEVARAVQSSMSIPLFFEPYPLSNSFLVDGGLVSNFPVWVFEAELAVEGTVAIGYRLVQPRQPTYAINTFGEYAGELFHTALEGSTFQQVRGLSNLILIPIEISKNIPATKFDLTLEEQKALFFDGWQAADKELSKQENRTKLGLPPI